MKQSDDESFTKNSFEITTSTNNRFSEWNNAVMSRLRNALVSTIQKSTVVPKLIVVILEDDVIKKVKLEGDVSYVYGRAIHWLLSEFRKLIEIMLEMLPQKSKRDEHPYVLWIMPTRHRDYKNDIQREKFNEKLMSISKLYHNNFTLELKQLWRKDESLLYNKNENKLTSYGLKTFWRSVDRTIKFCNSIIDRITAKKLLQRINGTTNPAVNRGRGFHHPPTSAQGSARSDQGNRRVVFNDFRYHKNKPLRCFIICLGTSSRLKKFCFVRASKCVFVLILVPTAHFLQNFWLPTVVWYRLAQII